MEHIWNVVNTKKFEKIQNIFHIYFVACLPR